MDLKETLIGKVVALDPKYLSQDKILLSKQTAIIESVNLQLGMAVVTFEDGNSDVIEYSKLIVLKPYEEIVRKLIRNIGLPTDDFQTLISICNFYRKGFYLEAMKLVLTKDSIGKTCTLNCVLWLDIKKNQKSGKDKKYTPKS